MGMAKYIDREALVEWLKCVPLKDLSDGRGLCRVIMEDDFKKAIKKMPKGIIVDVAPVRHGRWIEQEKYTFGTMYDCSICGNRILDNGHSWNYCPNCGAKMDEMQGLMTAAEAKRIIHPDTTLEALECEK